MFHYRCFPPLPFLKRTLLLCNVALRCQMLIFVGYCWFMLSFVVDRCILPKQGTKSKKRTNSSSNGLPILVAASHNVVGESPRPRPPRSALFGLRSEPLL